MKYVFFGSPEFAKTVLVKLIEAGYIPSVVVCNPDRPSGRKKIITPPAVKKLLAEKLKNYNVEIMQPDKIDDDFLDKLKRMDPDLFIVAAYSKIIPDELIKIPKLGTIGVHPSILPKYRGASPIQSAILNGDEKTGVSLFLIDEKMDHGPVIATEEIIIRNINSPVSKYYTSELTEELANTGGKLLAKILPDFLNGNIIPKQQDDSRATFIKKTRTEDAFIELSDLEKAQGAGGKTAIEILRKIRALNPEPGTWTLKDGKRMKILEAELTDRGNLKIKKIQFEGKKSTDI